MDNLEEEYTERVEREEELFLEGLQNRKSLAELEKEYSKKVKEIRRIYEKSLKKELKKGKENPPIKNLKKAEKNEKEFHVETLDLEKSWKEEKQIELASFSYRTGRKIKNFAKKNTPNWIIYRHYRNRIILKKVFKGIGNFFKNIYKKISENILNILTYIKEGFMKVLSELKRIIFIFKRKKGKEDKTSKKEGEEKKNDKKSD